MKKNQKWEWTERQEKAFQGLKEKFTTELVLAAPDLNKKITIEVDISDYTVREVLFMKYENGKWKLIVFLSKSLNKTEKNYEIHNKEILAIIKELENWRYLLKDVDRL